MALMFAPHLLFVRNEASYARDELGRTVAAEPEEEWRCVGECRCDDGSVSEAKSDNAAPFRPSYSVVCDSGCDVKVGDTVRILWSKDYSERGSGVVRNLTRTNVLGYMSFQI